MNATNSKNIERLALLLISIAGLLLLVNGLRFAVFGVLLATIMPASGMILVVAGLLVGGAVLFGILVYWRSRVSGSVFIMLASLWGILVSGASYLGPALGFFSSLVLLYIHSSSIDRRKAISFLLIGSILLLPLFGVLMSRSRDYHYLTVEGLQRQYLLHIPESYNGSEPVPLLVALHGGGGDASSMKRSYGLDMVADQYGFIVAYPDGTGDMQYSLHTWNSGYIDAYASRNNIDDVRFIDELIDHLIGEYEINTSAIYMTGHSNGAMMTYRFAAEHPDTLAGIAPVSGSVGGRMDEESELYIIPEPPHPLSVVHIHGKLDEQVLYEGGKGEKGFLADRIDLSVNESVAFWVESNNCSSVPLADLSTNNRIEMWIYPDGLQDTRVLLVTLLHGNHAWANMSTEVSSENFYGSSLAELIWLLLSGH